MRALRALLLGALWLVTCGSACGSPDSPGPVAGAPVAQAPAAGCASCHDPSEGPGGLHGPMPCHLCHAGDPQAPTMGAAHIGLELEPGALDRVGQTCGQAACHAREAERTLGSPMATARGLVSVDRWLFGELPLPAGHQTIAEVLATEAPSPGEDHIRRLCAGCHLQTRRDNRDHAVTGASGCGACHSRSKAAGAPHAPIDAVPPDSRCFGCHSRSARISLSYQGLVEVAGPAADACAQGSALPDGRTVCSIEDDAHHAAGLACVDCHLHSELMGDGTPWQHQEQAVEITCTACHGPTPQTTWANIHDPVTQAILRLRGQERPPTEAVRTGRRGTPIWNLRPSNAGWALHPKAGGPPKAVPPTPADAQHALPGHERLECSTCHAAWAPSCPECHTSFDPAGQQWDFGTGKVQPGKWVEASAPVGHAPPALAVTAQDRVVPAAPGMILTLETPATDPVRRRLFARSAPHTTGKQARDCASCHRSAGALGLGTGTLTIGDEGGRLHASFTPRTPAGPGLAADGWVPLHPAAPGEGTRGGLRSLNSAEQERVLQVGACLPCHEPTDPIWQDWPDSLRRRHAGTTPCPEPR